LGVLPLGTGNAFARSLGIPLDFDRAVEALADGAIAAVDLGRVNGNYFANTASVGLSAAVARRISRRLKRRFGLLAYGLIGTMLLVTYRPFRCTVTADEARLTVDTRQIVIANGRFFGAWRVAPDAQVDDGALALFTMGEERRLEYARVWAAFLLGRHTALRGAHCLSTRAALVETEPRKAVNADGEVVGRTPMRFTVAERALRVLVPRRSPAAENSGAPGRRGRPGEERPSIR
jgi:YegS/Rv2252/BmrU family lipid kinase